MRVQLETAGGNGLRSEVHLQVLCQSVLQLTGQARLHHVLFRVLGLGLRNLQIPRPHIVSIVFRWFGYLVSLSWDPM